MSLVKIAGTEHHLTDRVPGKLETSMANQTRVAQGERNLDDRSSKTVTHKFDYRQRENEEYEQGVSVELSPLYDFSIEPWAMLRHLIRQLTIAHLVFKYTSITKLPVQIKLLDVGANYAELWTLLSRQMKAKGARLQYIGIDIDKDKKIIANQLRPSADYRIMDVLDIGRLPENPFDVIVCAETLEHVEESKGIALMNLMYDTLAPNGLLIMSVPTPESETHRDNPFHVRLWSMREVIELGETIGFKTVDAFHLGVSKSDWPQKVRELEDRIPTELCRIAASAIVGSTAIGPNFIYVGVKSDDSSKV